MKWRHWLAIGLALFVLVVLLGAFLPMLHTRTSTPAYRTACLGNLKQCGLGLSQYGQDFDGRYPWHAGATGREGAWRNLGLLYPNYLTHVRVFICPEAKDREFEPMCDTGPKEDHPFEPFRDRRKERISYAYRRDAPRLGPFTRGEEGPLSTVRVLADKKAGIALNEQSNHKAEGRMVLYRDLHAKWKTGPDALDPDEADDTVGAPDADDYTAWWSDPPYYGE